MAGGGDWAGRDAGGTMSEWRVARGSEAGSDGQADYSIAELEGQIAELQGSIAAVAHSISEPGSLKSDLYRSIEAADGVITEPGSPKSEPGWTRGIKWPGWQRLKGIARRLGPEPKQDALRKAWEMWLMAGFREDNFDGVLDWYDQLCRDPAWLPYGRASGVS